MANLSTYYPAPITATDLGLGAASNATFGSLTANNGTLTASAPVLDLGQTWNASGTTFTGLRFTVAETAAAIGSRYFSIDSGGTSIFSLQTRGAGNGSEVISISGPSRGMVFGPHGTASSTSFFSLRWQQNLAGLASNAIFAWGSDVYNLNYDLAIQRDAAHTLAQRIGTNPQTYNIYNTFTSATNPERLRLAWASNVAIIGTEKGSGGGTARALEFQTDGTTRITIGASGGLTSFGDITIQQSSRYRFGSGGTRLIGTSDGLLRISNAAENDFDRLQFGGTTSSFPALKRSSATLQVRLADDSADAALSFSNATASGQINTPIIRSTTSWLDISDSSSGPRFGFFQHGGMLLRDSGYFGWNASGTITSSSTGDLRLFRDAAAVLALRNDANAQTFRIYNTVSGTGNVNFDRVNFRWASNEFIIDAEAGGTGTLRGIKIGSATSSLLGFYGATPVDRPATVADPAGGGTIDTEARTAINDIIDRLQELGLIA